MVQRWPELLLQGEEDQIPCSHLHQTIFRRNLSARLPYFSRVLTLTYPSNLSAITSSLIVSANRRVSSSSIDSATYSTNNTTRHHFKVTGELKPSQSRESSKVSRNGAGEHAGSLLLTIEMAALAWTPFSSASMFSSTIVKFARCASGIFQPYSFIVAAMSRSP